ncbi:MAG: hypothetical protein JNK38_16965 [Acidobacteria bacterium]|nr:hypothetical protein [Acidobacteriota bacterium]
MKLAGRIALVLLVAVTSIAAQVQSPVEQVKPPVEIVKHKIGMDYYPMLDRPSSTTPSMSAENGDMPMSDAERIARQRSRSPSNKINSAPIAPGDSRSRGRLRSYTRVIDAAEYVLIELKNSDTKTIKSVDWDFAFPRYENGQLQLRFDVKSAVEIKPGGKKTLKHKLPPNAKKCEVVKVISDEEQPDKVSTFEAVCGQGFHDPSLQNQKQETITIKRIEFADGTVWSRQ